MKPLQSLSDDDIATLARRARGELLTAPAALVERAAGIWRTGGATTVSETASGPVQRLLATLRFDSWAAEAALAVRSEPLETRQLLYSVDGVDVDLRVTRLDAAETGSPRVTVGGQILGPDGPCALVLLGEGVESRCELDEFGEFAFEPVPALPLRLIVFIAGMAIELPEFDVAGGR